MTHFKTNMLIVVAPALSSVPVPVGKQLVHIDDVNSLFPVIHELQPGGLLLDHDYLGDQTEKILRRIVFNPFYSKLKIYCYKSKPHTKIDALLKVLGVQKFIYAQDAQKQTKHSRAFKLIGELLKTTVSNKLADAGY